jgi:hypothetical protein
MQARHTWTSRRLSRPAVAFGIQSATPAEKRAAKRIKGIVHKYQMVDAVEKKGENVARWHWGYIAEEVRDVLIDEGLDPWRYGFMCFDRIVRRETYIEQMTSEKKALIVEDEEAVEIESGRPVLKTRRVERMRAIGTMRPILNAAGEPVMERRVVPGAGGDREPEYELVPRMHFVPEMEAVEIERTREVWTDEFRLGLRYRGLQAFLQCAEPAPWTLLFSGRASTKHRSQ